MLFTWHIIKITAYTLKKNLFNQNAKVHDEQRSAKFIVCIFFRKLWAREDSEMQLGKCCHGDYMARKRHIPACEGGQAIGSGWNVGSIWVFLMTPCTMLITSSGTGPHLTIQGKQPHSSSSQASFLSFLIDFMY